MYSAIADAADGRLWAATMASVGATDVYYLLEYHKLYSSADRRCKAYIARRGGEILVYPFFLRPVGCIGSVKVSSRLHDIETVYGFTGPIATTDCPEFLEEAWRGFKAWCLENGVVAEFIRFHPLLRTQRFAAVQAEIRLDRENVVVLLEGDEDRLWRSYPSTQRNRLRKALKMGLTCREADVCKELEVFVALYEATMQRRSATNFYWFPQKYYDLMRQTLGANTKLFLVEHKGKAVAGGIFFVAGKTVHYHLGGSCAEAQRFAPNNLLFHQVAMWAQQQGFEYLHLGGGRSNAPDDMLLRFKKRFSRHTVPFYLGKRVHDQAQYDSLCTIWMEEYGESTLPSYFPAYRARFHQPRKTCSMMSLGSRNDFEDCARGR